MCHQHERVIAPSQAHLIRMARLVIRPRPSTPAARAAAKERLARKVAGLARAARMLDAFVAGGRSAPTSQGAAPCALDGPRIMLARVATRHEGYDVAGRSGRTRMALAVHQVRAGSATEGLLRHAELEQVGVPIGLRHLHALQHAQRVQAKALDGLHGDVLGAGCAEAHQHLQRRGREVQFQRQLQRSVWFALGERAHGLLQRGDAASNELAPIHCLATARAHPSG